MFELYMNFMGRWGMLIYLLLALVPVVWAVIAQIRLNRRNERARIARDFGIEAESAEARRLKRMRY